MDYSQASTEEKNIRLVYLNVPSKEMSQDVIDKSNLASTYLNLERCTKCLRLKNQNYICPHCGNYE
jgi:hypothetical protein